MMTCARRNHAPRAFSLIEVLLAIFILGVGVISIAALFPAGIAQQRASVDDSIGPTIANNAISLLRTKLSPEDFGTFEQFGVASPRPTISGDWPWLRPAFMFVPGAGPLDERGSINVFSAGAYGATEFSGGYPGSAPVLNGIPFNTARYDNPLTPAFDPTPPRIIFSQTERYYPASTQNAIIDVGKPQYVWDCMFRRFQGKILVAIFVYRVTQQGGGAPLYMVAPNPDDATVPPLPIWLDLANLPSPPYDTADDAGPWDVFGPDQLSNTSDDLIVVGTADNALYDPDDHAQAWQESRQWILDHHNGVHRVVGREWEEEEGAAGRMQIDFARQIPSMPALPVYYVAPGGDSVDDVVRDIWYLPLGVDSDGDDAIDQTLTPVYVTVKEL
jgi:prepilin-type N-terminal cleavage/methylation domain-containing protein